MNFRRGQDDNVEINVTSLIDVVLLLLIFFMVSTTFLNPEHINLTLPTANKASEQKDEPKPIDITINRDGQYFVNGTALVNNLEETLKQALTDAGGGQDEPRVLIHADANTTHQSVITVLDVARQLGWLHLSFATEVRKDQPATSDGK
ncbi:MAG: biopolymer transporter ExbD [Gammaproteobacteria bacterium]